MKRKTNLLKAFNRHRDQLYFPTDALVWVLRTRDLLFKTVPFSVETSLKSAQPNGTYPISGKRTNLQIFNNRSKPASGAA